MSYKLQLCQNFSPVLNIALPRTPHESGAGPWENCESLFNWVTAISSLEWILQNKMDEVQLILEHKQNVRIWSSITFTIIVKHTHINS